MMWLELIQLALVVTAFGVAQMIAPNSYHRWLLVTAFVSVIYIGVAS